MSRWGAWWDRQSRGRKGLMIGGTAVLVVGAGAAASDNAQTGAQRPPVATTTPEKSFERFTTTPTTMQAPTTTVAAAVTTTAPPTTLAPVVYTVTEVIDGDTISVAPSDGSAELAVRLVGIDALESGACEADAATWTLASMISGHEVSLTSGGDGEDTDRYGRFLRYVDVGGVDAALRLIEDGVAVARYDSRDGYGGHEREASYIVADDTSPTYVCPPPTTLAPPVTQAPPPPPPTPPLPAPAPVLATPASSGGCDPNYTGCVPIDSDVDCAGGSGNGPSYTGYVQVIGNDVYDLDRDGDGEARE